MCCVIAIIRGRSCTEAYDYEVRLNLLTVLNFFVLFLPIHLQTFRDCLVPNGYNLFQPHNYDSESELSQHN